MSDNIGATLVSQPVLARLAEISRRIGDMSPAMLAIGEALTESTKQRFDTSTAPDGSKWKPNAEGTVLSVYATADFLVIACVATSMVLGLVCIRGLTFDRDGPPDPKPPAGLEHPAAEA